MQKYITGYWWFGINNKDETYSNSSGHVKFRPKFENFLKGNVEMYRWPRNKRNHRRYYDRMKEGDPVLFWMGDGEFWNWGIIGFGYVDKNSYGTKEIFLKRDYVPDISIQPYENGYPRETDNTKFLENNFPLDFKPLTRTFTNLGMTDKKAIVTIDTITKHQFDICKAYAISLNSK